jgi:hypothetical protein
MITDPITEVNTGMESKLPAGRCGVSDLYASVCPINIDNGIKMKRSMYRNCGSVRLEPMEYRSVTVVN